MTSNQYYLIHHGILGQKWGVRRYQNSDGSLTEAGLKRYSKLKRKDFRQLGRHTGQILDWNTAKSKTDWNNLDWQDQVRLKELTADHDNYREKVNKGGKIIDEYMNKNGSVPQKVLDKQMKNITKMNQAYDKYKNENKENSIPMYLVRDLEVKPHSEKIGFNWDRIPRNTSYTDYWKIYNHTDPKTVKDQELKELMKMEYDEFKNSKK